MKNIIYYILCVLFACFHTAATASPFLDNYAVPKRDIAPYLSPTERQIAYESSSKISVVLKQKRIPSPEWEFWNLLIAQEERGIFGYHAAKQELRIFHDIVKMVFEEILEFEIKKDFFFFRVPLDPAVFDYDAQTFLKNYPYIDDALPEQRNQVVSLNYSLFGNFNDDSQSTVYYFSHNHSWFMINYQERLKFLFNTLGIPLDSVSTLFKAGSSIKSFPTGVIYQFFDCSHHTPHKNDSYHIVDQFCYPAIGAGPLDIRVQENLSQVFQNTSPQKFDRNTGQIRLLMHGNATLNPYGSLSICRHDVIDPEVIKSYENQLRALVQKLPYDHEKVQKYKNTLEVLWNVQN